MRSHELAVELLKLAEYCIEDAFEELTDRVFELENPKPVTSNDDTRQVLCDRIGHALSFMGSVPSSVALDRVSMILRGAL